MIRKILLGLLAFILIIAIGAFIYYRLVIYKPLPISDKDRAAVNLMPLPAKLNLKSGSVDISAGLKIDYPGVSNSMIEKLNFLETGENGVIVAVVPGLRKIILGV
ncbi:MAG: hypothetical protein QNK30_16615 [Bacteroidales bacterium]|nr:hypothetical protein [Bacteroidales bacterium]